MNSFDSATRILARRAYSEQELRTKLEKQGYSTPEIDDTIQRLIERGYLNDTALCELLYKEYSRVHSNKYIFVKLQQRGFSLAAINTVMASCYSDHNEFTNAMKIVQKRYKDISNVDYKKVVRYLSSKGFSYTIIEKILNYHNIKN